MDIDRFDQIARLLTRSPRRRTVFAAALGAFFAGSGTGSVAAGKKRKKCSPCKKRKRGKCKPKPNGTPCGGGKRCQGGHCRCRATCAIAADCCDGQDCLSNSSCAQPCVSSQDCGEGCGCQLTSTEGAKHCIEILTCQEASQICANITGCLAGEECMVTACSGGANRCFPLCVAA